MRPEQHGAQGLIRRDKFKRGKHHAGESGSSDGDDESDEDATGPPNKFVLAGDKTGSGIDYNILEEESWQNLEEYCKKWNLKQAHLESIFSRFARTILRTEHLDFTSKPQFHASLDFVADEFMGTAGEFAAQTFIQTWFLRRKRGLKPPRDRRCIDFTRLVVMCCDLARLGDYELLVNLWTCVLHRFSGILPAGTVNLDTRLNTELVKEVITVLHTSVDRKLNLLVNMLLAESAELDGLEEGESSTESESTSIEGMKTDDQHGDDAEEEPKRQVRRYLTLRNILRFSFQYPPLLFPVVQFQRVLRSKIIGRRYWLRRRIPAHERKVSIQTSLGLPDAYHDIFDRIESRQQAWIVASGHLLLHALDPPPPVTTTIFSDASCVNRGAGDRRERRAGSGEGDGNSGGTGAGRLEERFAERYRRLLNNCLQPQWYEVAETPAPTRVGAVGIHLSPVLMVALSRFKVNATRMVSPKSSLTSPVAGGTRNATPSREGKEGTAPAAAAATQPNEPPPVVADNLTPRTPSKSRVTSKSSQEGRDDRSRKRSGDHATSTSTGAQATAAAATKTCAICLKRFSPAAMCRKCGRLAAKAFKDARGSRQARVILVPFGASLGVAEPSALQREGDAVKRWVRLLDDETGAEFYYNAHYDTSVWKSGIELPDPAPVVKNTRRRKGGGRGMLAGPTSGKPPSLPGSPTAPVSPKGPSEEIVGGSPAAAAVASTSPDRVKTAFSGSSMATLQAAASGGDSVQGVRNSTGTDTGAKIQPTYKLALKVSAGKPSPLTPQKRGVAPHGRPRAVLLAEASANPEVVLDAHKRMYPPFRLVSWEEDAAGEMEGVSPPPGLRPATKTSSRGGSATPGGSAAATMTRTGTIKRAGTMKGAGYMSAANDIAAAVT